MEKILKRQIIWNKCITQWLLFPFIDFSYFNFLQYLIITVLYDWTHLDIHKFQKNSAKQTRNNDDEENDCANENAEPKTKRQAKKTTNNKTRAKKLSNTQNDTVDETSDSNDADEKNGSKYQLNTKY